MQRFKVVVVEDDQISANAVKRVLECDKDIEVVGVAYNGETLLAEIENWMPDVVLMDLHLSSDVSGVYYIRRLKEINPRVGIIVWTNFRIDNQQVIAAFRAGINGYILKGRDYLQIYDRVKTVARGENYVDAEMANTLLKAIQKEPDLIKLTKRELEVLSCLGETLSNGEIAVRLNIQEDTVKKHVSNILQKLHLDDRTKAALYAYKQGLTT